MSPVQQLTTSEKSRFNFCGNICLRLLLRSITSFFQFEKTLTYVALELSGTQYWEASTSPLCQIPQTHWTNRFAGLGLVLWCIPQFTVHVGFTVTSLAQPCHIVHVSGSGARKLSVSLLLQKKTCAGKHCTRPRNFLKTFFTPLNGEWGSAI